MTPVTFASDSVNRPLFDLMSATATGHTNQHILQILPVPLPFKLPACMHDAVNGANLDGHVNCPSLSDVSRGSGRIRSCRFSPNDAQPRQSTTDLFFPQWKILTRSFILHREFEKSDR